MHLRNENRGEHRETSIASALKIARKCSNLGDFGLKSHRLTPGTNFALPPFSPFLPARGQRFGGDKMGPRPILAGAGPGVTSLEGATEYLGDWMHQFMHLTSI